MKENLLEINQLQVAFQTDHGEVTSIEDVSFTLKHGETIGIVGESGCGKSVTSLSIIGLLGQKGKIRKGNILFENKDLAQYSEAEMRKIRGNEISMIFQEPMTSLNPVFTIGHQLIEGIRTHRKITTKNARRYAIEMLQKVGIPRAEEIINEYPHALSGGMRQRVMIAMALSCEPKLLIADEPTTALDVTIQAQILELMKDLKHEFNTSIMLITHDLGVIAEMTDRVIVMYAGQVVEETDVFTLFSNPKHPYTIGLMNSIPHLVENRQERLEAIPGTVPSLQEMPKGCRFQTRCPHTEEQCMNQAPALTLVESGHHARCWLVNRTSEASQEVSHG